MVSIFRNNELSINIYKLHICPNQTLSFPAQTQKNPAGYSDNAKKKIKITPMQNLSLTLKKKGKKTIFTFLWLKYVIHILIYIIIKYNCV